MSYAAASKIIVMAAVLASAFAPLVSQAASTTVTAHVCRAVIDPTSLTVSSPNPTVDPTADLAGTAEPGAAVTISNHGTDVATVLSDGTGHYAVTLGLDVGDNQFVATAADACGHQAVSPQLVVHRVQVPPPAPTLGSQYLPGSITTTSDTDVYVDGQTEPGAIIKFWREAQVLGAATKAEPAPRTSGQVLGSSSDILAGTFTADSSGHFAGSLALLMGKNVFYAVSSNPAGDSPESPKFTVIRVPVPVAPAATPTPTPAPAPAPPARGALPVPVMSVSGPVTHITGNSVVITVQVAVPSGAPTTLELLQGDVVRYSALLGADGTAIFEVALDLGINTFTTRLRRGTQVGELSAPFTITRQAPALTAPKITAPAGETTVKHPWVVVSGTADPGSRLVVYAGKQVAARFTVSNTGAFSVRVPLELGTTAIYAEASRGDEVKRSAVTLVTYGSTSLVARLGRTLAGLPAAFAAAVRGVGAAAVQFAGDFSEQAAASPALTILILGLSLLTLTLLQGLLGLEWLLALVPLVRGWRLPARFATGARPVLILDAVTCRPLPFVRVNLRGRHAYALVSDWSGHVSLPAGTHFDQLQLIRPGYQPLETVIKNELLLEPVPPKLSLGAILADVLLAVVAWILLVAAVFVSLTLATNQPGAATFSVAALFVGLLGANLLLLVTRPRIRWGSLTDNQTHAPIPGATIELRAPIGYHVSTYVTHENGRYALRAPQGEYDMTVKARGYAMYRERITVRRHGTYLGFKLRLDPK